MKFTSIMAALLGMAAAFAPASVCAQDQNAIATALQAKRAERWPLVGVMADVGVPDGAIASLVIRPWQWFRAYGGGGSNSVSKGWRGGFSLLPFGAGPSLSLEYGHYSDGDANGLVRRMVSGEFKSNTLLDKVGYDYANAHVGLDFGGKNVIFYVHGGVSRVWAQMHNVNDAFGSSGSSTVVSVSQDPKVTVTGSSLKIGLIVFLM
jgi:hypothetical protein